MNVEQTIIETIARECNIPLDSIKPSTNLADLGLDEPLDFDRLIIVLEEEELKCQVESIDDEFRKCQTVQDLADVFKRYIV